MTRETRTANRFLRAVRRRLWRLEALRTGGLGLWAVGAVLIVLGVVHAFITEVDPGIVLTALAATAAAAAMIALLRRPSLRAAAVSADRRFGGRALMTTALECLSGKRSPASPAGRIVLEQADAAARAWRPRLGQQLRWEPKGSSAAVLIPVFVGVLLLAQPGDQGIPDRSAGEPGAAAPANGPGVGNDAQLSEDLATLRRELAAERPGPEPAAAQTGAAGPRAAPEQTAGTRPGRQPSERAPGLHAGSAAGAGDTAGDAQPGETASATADARLAAGARIGIARNGGPAAAGTPTRRTYQAADKAPAYAPVETLPAAAPDSAAEPAFMSPSQAAYAARYLDTRGDTDD